MKTTVTREELILTAEWLERQAEKAKMYGQVLTEAYYMAEADTYRRLAEETGK
jgi:hypothetical protein